MSKRLFTAFAATLLLLTAGAVFAHDVPNDVVVQVFLKPDGQRLHMVIRAPLDARLRAMLPALSAEAPFWTVFTYWPFAQSTSRLSP